MRIRIIITFFTFNLLLIPILLIAKQGFLITPSGISYETVSKQGKGNNYETSKHYLSTSKHDLYSVDGQILSLDSTGGKAAILKTHLVPQKGADSEYNLYWYELVIQDTINTSIIASFANAHILSFSPGGACVVYSTAYPGERLDEYKAPQKFEKGVYIYDFTNKSAMKLDTLGVAPIDLNWSNHDGNIYIFGFDDNKVYRYNAATKKGEIVNYKGTYFTPDGKYYSNIATENIISKIYRTADNSEMAGWEKDIADASGSDFTNLVFVSKKLSAFVFYFGMSSKGVTNVVFDTKQGKVIGKFEGFVRGTNPDGNLVQINPLKSDRSVDYGKIVIIDLMQFKK